MCLSVCVYVTMCSVCYYSYCKRFLAYHSTTKVSPHYTYRDIRTRTHPHNVITHTSRHVLTHTHIHSHIPPVTPPIAHAHHTCTHKVLATQKDAWTCTASRDWCTCTTDGWWLGHTWVSCKVARTQMLQGQSEGDLSAEGLCRCYDPEIWKGESFLKMENKVLPVDTEHLIWAQPLIKTVCFNALTCLKTFNMEHGWSMEHLKQYCW